MQPRKRVQKLLINPVSMLFKFMQTCSRVEIWLMENNDIRFQGNIIGLDEYMNLTLDSVVEINVKRETQKHLGRIVLKSDNICLVHAVGDVKI
jgi:small nuclear ribonucleoprotein E